MREGNTEELEWMEGEKKMGERALWRQEERREELRKRRSKGVRKEGRKEGSEGRKDGETGRLKVRRGGRVLKECYGSRKEKRKEDGRGVSV